MAMYSYVFCCKDNLARFGGHTRPLQSIVVKNNNIICLVLCSDECAALDLDGHGGRTFLRVLLHLTMHDYPPLVSGALHLLFRHFSQRQEVLQAFKQVVIAGHKHYLFIKRLNLMRLYCNRVSGSSWVFERTRSLLFSGLRLREVCRCDVLSCVLLVTQLPSTSQESEKESQDQTGLFPTRKSQVVECL